MVNLCDSGDQFAHFVLFSLKKCGKVSVHDCIHGSAAALDSTTRLVRKF